MLREIDLSKPDDVLQYLSGTPFASSHVVPLSGGNANYLFRLYLQSPYDGMQTLVMKHGKALPSGDETFSFSVERQSFEARALEAVNAVLPSDMLARVPRLHHHDNKEHVLIMDDCGAEARTLKQLLKDGLLDIPACRTIGRALGAFLATIHRECTKDQELMQYLDQNTEMKRLSAIMSYGRLVDTLTGKRKGQAGEAVVDPPLAESLEEGTIQTVEMIAQETSQAIIGADAKSVFTMGDFWTGNIVVSTNVGTSGVLTVERIFVIDWEVTKPGLPCLDFGQFVAEMHTLRRFYEAPAKESVDEVLNEFFAAYKEGYPVDDVYLRGATAHLGAHLVAWTPVVGWGPKEKVRHVVEEGVEFLVMSKREKPDSLRKLSIIS